MLQDGIPIPKHHPTIQALAALDELNAHIGVIKSQLADPQLEYEQIQKTIMSIMSLVSTTSNKKPTSYSPISQGSHEFFTDETKALEASIDKISTMMPAIKTFVTYGMCEVSANLDLARAVARRAETCLSQAAETSDYAQWALPYVNRLSDYLYIKARYADFENTVIQAVKEALSTKSPTPAIRTEITLAQAKTLIENIEAKAKAINLPVVAACCNAAGNPIAVHVMDGALLVSYEGAIAKAYTAAALKMPTAELSKLVQPGQPFYGLETLGGGKLLPIGGGVPIFGTDGSLIGAIGVSGGTAEQDHHLASI